MHADAQDDPCYAVEEKMGELQSMVLEQEGGRVIRRQ